jgi:hypothetical protein
MVSRESQMTGPDLRAIGDRRKIEDNKQIR